MRFDRLAEFFDRVEATSGRSDMIAILAELCEDRKSEDATTAAEVVALYRKQPGVKSGT